MEAKRWDPGPHALARRDLKRARKGCYAADGSEVGNLGWIRAAPSLTAHSPLPPPPCRGRVRPVLVERLQGLSCHPGRLQGPKSGPLQPPTVSTPFSGRSSVSSAWVRQRRARRAAASYRLQGSGREARDGNPSTGEPRGPEGSLWLAARWRGESLATSPRAKTPPRERWASSQDVGLRVRAEGGRAGAPSPGPTEPRGSRAGAVQKAA